MGDPWMDAASAMPYVGDHPDQLVAVADLLLGGSALLARANDGVFDARSQLTAAWTGSSAAVADQQLSIVLTATERGAQRLDTCRRAVETCSEALALTRSTIDELRSVCVSSMLAGGLPSAAQRTPSEIAAAVDDLVAQWADCADRADAATETCRDVLAGTLYSDQGSAGSAGVVYRGLDSALGLDGLTADDQFRAAAPEAGAEWALLDEQQRQLVLAGVGDFPPATDVSAAWSSLDPLQQEALIVTSPARIGAIDGLPAAVRDRANRLVLAEVSRGYAEAAGNATAQAATVDGVDKIVAEMTAAGLSRRSTELADLDAQLDQQQVGSGGPPTPVYLMSFDPTEIDRMAVSVGNPDTADHIAVLVPGTGNDLGTVPALISRAAGVGAATKAAGAPNTATVVWLGYDTPDTLPAAADDSYADDGAAPFAQFLTGLRDAHVGADPASMTAVFHSYAALLAGRAASTAPLAADQLVFVGAAGTELDSVEQLQLEGVASADVESRVTAITFTNDPIVRTGVAHDGLPGDPAFGARSVMLAGPAPSVGDRILTGAVDLTVDGLLPTVGPMVAPPLWSAGGAIDIDAHTAYFDQPQSTNLLGELIARDFPPR